MNEENTLPDSETIARYACMLWENAGQPHGRDLEFWLKAEVLLRASDPAGAPADRTASPSIALPVGSERPWAPTLPDRQRQPKGSQRRSAKAKTAPQKQ